MKFKKEDILELIMEEDIVLADGAVAEIVHQEESRGKHDCTDVYIVFSVTAPSEVTTHFCFQYDFSYNDGIQHDYWDDMVECAEVVPEVKTVVTYRSIK